MNLKNRFTQREIEIMGYAAVFFLSCLVFVLITWATSGCVCRDNSLNFSLINSRSPAINANGTNELSAANGYSGGGHLEAEVPMIP